MRVYSYFVRKRLSIGLLSDRGKDVGTRRAAWGYVYANYRELTVNFWIAKKMRKLRKDAKTCWMLEHPRFFLRELSRIKRELSVNFGGNAKNMRKWRKDAKKTVRGSRYLNEKSNTYSP